jgi:hypothetical protein
MAVRWKGDRGVTGKLKIIMDTNVSEQKKQEIVSILDEIENADDRNSIYMSSWLSRRLAMKYKNYLVTLRE